MKKILWVDDDLTYTLRVYVDEFEDNNFSILRASDATEGKNEFNRLKDDIDAVILDIMMPPGEEFDSIETKGGFASGLVLARYIKREKPNIPIVGFSVIRNLEVREWFSKNNLLFLSKQDTLPLELFEYVNSAINGLIKKKLNIFIVHGHDDITKLELKNYIQNSFTVQDKN